MKTPSLRFSLWLFLILLIGAATAPLWHLMRESDPAGQTSSASARPTIGEKRAVSAERSNDAPVAEPAPKTELTGRAQALAVAKNAAAHTIGVPELDAFNAWTARYLAVSFEERKALVDEGITLATARRSALAKLIPSDPRRAVENAVPPVVRQELPAAIAARLEERVNEKAFFGVLGIVPSADAPETPAYRREVRTDDGGYYRAFVYGNRGAQPTTASASIVGIAVDDVLAVDERPLRIVASGEIPNHPNNLTRRRTVVPLDEQGFTLGREVRETPAPPRDVVETCPVSGKSTPAPKAQDGGLAAVTGEQVVVEAGGQVHFLCSGGHILGFEGDLIAQEGGNGGPSKPTSPPAATQSTGYKSHLLMRVAFPEALKGSVTEAEGHTLGKNVQDWFVDSSFGAMSFLTTVSPLIVLPRTEAWYKSQDTGSAFEVLTDARAASKAAGFDPANFDFDTVIYTGTPGSFGGQAYVGGKGCWLKSGTGTGVAVHEYGHNFSLWHSNFWSTTNGSAIGGGSHVEYGDSFDTMGSANAGDYHFNAFQKNLLNWMPTAVVHDVSASGSYRIYQMDQPTQDPRQRYAIKIRKDADRDYWVDFRQKFATNAWVQGGVFLHWSPWAPSGSGPHLLDTTPGSIDGKNDAPLVVGRTFSDPETGIHITPVAKNATTPPSMDVVVNIGTFVGNQAPTVALGASATSVATGVAVNFTATASDPDGDALSYAWDFGDKSFSTLNSPTVSKSWATAGEYRVRCMVSDMKGQTASSSVVITVGSPTTFRVSGTITAGGLPLQGVRVTTSSRDTYTESDGTYTITGLAAGTYTLVTQLYGYTLTPAGSATVTVGPSASGVNFTAADLPQVSIAVQDSDCSEGANTGTFRISRTGSSAAALTVSCYYPSGSAAKGSDYSFAPDIVSVTPFYTLTIPAGQAFLDVVVTALDDTASESFESTSLELVPSTSYSLGTAAATLMIADTDTANPLVRLRVSDRDALESGDPGQFIIERLGSTTNSLSVSVAISGTASNGTDYATIPTTVTIAAGASTAAVNVTPLQDSAVEPMETVTLTINTNAAYIRAASTADYAGSVNLHDDDAPILTVVATDSAAAEAGNDPGVFTVTRTGDTSQALTVNYGLTGSALHGTDYVPLPGVLTIPAGSSTATVVITPIDDAIGEAAQTAVFQIRSGTSYAVGAASNATVTITDNTDLPYATINLITGPAVESGTAGTFRITTTGTGTGNIAVSYTVSGTATNGTDYSLLSGTVSMGKNATSTITITPLQDAFIEGYETITLTLNPDPTYSLALDSLATMILQDDELPQVSVSETDDGFSEANGSLAIFYVSRTGATTNPLTVNYTMAGTAISGVDYTAPSGTVTIPAAAAGAFVNVSLLADTLAEGTETMTLNVIPDPAYALGLGSATRYIADVQSASVATQVRFSASTSSAAESAGTVNIPVTLSAAAAGNVTVQYFINGGTALGAGLDYQLAAGLLTFAPGETSKNVPVVVTDDTLAESSETLIIALGNPNNARLGTSSHTLTITDNDPQSGPTYTVFASASPTAGGTTAGGGTFNGGSNVTVTATANAGYSFVNWTEAGTPVSASASYTFSISANRTLVANFATTTYTVSTSAAPAAGGTTAGGGTFNGGSNVTVTATANAGYSFVNWTEGGTPVSALASYTFTLSANRTLVANFTPITYTVSTSASPAAGGTASGGGTFNSGSSVTVTATANAGYSFVNWTEGGTAVSASASYTFTLGANRTLVANFTPITYAVSTSASPAAGGTTAGGGTFNSGSSVTVTAAANAGYAFVNWTEGASVVSSTASYNFTLSANRTLVANFTPTYTVGTSSSPAEGGTTTGGGTFNGGSNVTATATANAGYAFVNWTEGGTPVSTSASYTFPLSANRTLVANFALTTYNVSTSASPVAGGTTAGGGTFDSGSSVTVTATANAGYAFVNWTEGGTPVSTSASYVFTIIANRTLLANFTPTYTVSTSSTPAAGGTTSGGGTFNSGSSVTVTATANAGYAFVNWTEGASEVSTSGSYTFPLSANRTLVANFTPITYTVATSSSPAAGGTTSGGGTFNSGSSVTVTATATAGYVFVNWTEGASEVSTSASYTFPLSANRTLIANFVPTYTVSTSSAPAAGGSTSGDGTFNSGSSVTVTATANSNYAFVNWTEGGTEVSTSASYTFAISTDRVLVANFGPALPPPWVQSDIGTPGAVGTGTYSGGIYTVAGAGTVGGKADKFHFVYQTLSADGEIVARIPSFQNTGSAARIGVMIRDTLAPGSKSILLGVNGSGTYKWMRRTTTGGNTTNTNSNTGTAPNVWVKLTRVGSTITASKSTNGTSWTTIGSTTVTMATNCYFGLVVASGTTSLNTSTFDNVAVTP